MKITTRFILTLSIFLLILVGMATSLIITDQQVDRLNQQDEIAHHIAQVADELSYLTGDYLMYGESQQRDRWEASFASFTENITRLELKDPALQAIIGRLEADRARLWAVFGDVAETIDRQTQLPDTHPGLLFTQLSWSRMEVQIQAATFEASLLSRKLQEQADRLTKRNLVLMFSLIGTFGLYLLFNYYLIYHRTLRSIAELHTGAKVIGSGNLDFAIPVKRMDEVGELSLAFNQMTANLKEVTASKADLEREIAERKLAEEALAETALMLERSNRELEQFAFIASHDLQEPLRKIKSFGGILQQKLQGQLDEEIQDSFQRMISATERMQVMINSLLQLSRVNTQGQPFVPVDLSKVAVEVVSDLEMRILQAGGQVVIEALPWVEADPIQIHQALQNLIGNGLKFHKAGTPPIVKVSGKIDKSENGKGRTVSIQVEDNGIGFEEQQLEKIMQPFQRLHSRDEYEGTGMGLAIVKKIIERHHGEIDAHSNPGVGSTFIITLPVKNESS